MIKEVVCVAANLEPDAPLGPDVEGLAERDVGIGQAGADDLVSFEGAKGIRSRNREGARVIPLLEAVILVARVSVCGLVVSGEVRKLGATAAVGGVVIAGYLYGIATLGHQRSRELPAADYFIRKRIVGQEQTSFAKG